MYVNGLFFGLLELLVLKLIVSGVLLEFGLVENVVVGFWFGKVIVILIEELVLDVLLFIVKVVVNILFVW